MRQPEENACVERHLVGAARPAVAHLLEKPSAKIVTSPFANGGAQLKPKHIMERGNVLVHQLVLQVNRVGGDDDTPSVRRGPVGGRQQITEALARARAGFHQDMPAIIESLDHRSQHLYLLRPVFEVRERALEAAAGLNERRQSCHIERGRFLHRHKDLALHFGRVEEAGQAAALAQFVALEGMAGAFGQCLLEKQALRPAQAPAGLNDLLQLGQ